MRGLLGSKGFGLKMRYSQLKWSLGKGLRWEELDHRNKNKIKIKEKIKQNIK